MCPPHTVARGEEFCVHIIIPYSGKFLGAKFEDFQFLKIEETIFTDAVNVTPIMCIIIQKFWYATFSRLEVDPRKT